MLLQKDLKGKRMECNLKDVGFQLIGNHKQVKMPTVGDMITPY